MTEDSRLTIERGSSDAAGREAEHGYRLPVLPPAQAGDELDASSVCGSRGQESKFTPPPAGPGLPPISLADRRRPVGHAPGRRTRAADDLLATLGGLCALAARQGIDVVEVDWMDLSAVLLLVASLEAGIAWAAENHGCVGEGCRWPEEMNRVMEGVLR